MQRIACLQWQQKVLDRQAHQQLQPCKTGKIQKESSFQNLKPKEASNDCTLRNNYLHNTGIAYFKLQCLEWILCNTPLHKKQTRHKGHPAGFQSCQVRGVIGSGSLNTGTNKNPTVSLAWAAGSAALLQHVLKLLSSVLRSDFTTWRRNNACSGSY